MSNQNQTMQERLGLTDIDVTNLVRFAVVNKIAEGAEPEEYANDEDEAEEIIDSNAYIDRVLAAFDMLAVAEADSYE